MHLSVRQTLYRPPAKFQSISIAKMSLTDSCTAQQDQQFILAQNKKQLFYLKWGLPFLAFFYIELLSILLNYIAILAHFPFQFIISFNIALKKQNKTWIICHLVVLRSESQGSSCNHKEKTVITKCQMGSLSSPDSVMLQKIQQI